MIECYVTGWCYAVPYYISMLIGSSRFISYAHVYGRSLRFDAGIAEDIHSGAGTLCISTSTAQVIATCAFMLLEGYHYREYSVAFARVRPSCWFRVVFLCRAGPQAASIDRNDLHPSHNRSELY